MTNYLFYDYATSQICLIQHAQKTYLSYSSIKSYLNTLCLYHGSTLEGRRQSFQFLMNQKKFIPIVVSIHPILIFFPLESIQNPKCIWVNYAQIQDIIYHEKKCEIIFKDSTHLVSDHPTRIQRIVQSIWRYLQIQGH